MKYSEMSKPQRWQWHAEVYALRRVLLGVAPRCPHIATRPKGRVVRRGCRRTRRSGTARQSRRAIAALPSRHRCQKRGPLRRGRGVADSRSSQPMSRASAGQVSNSRRPPNEPAATNGRRKPSRSSPSTATAASRTARSNATTASSAGCATARRAFPPPPAATAAPAAPAPHARRSAPQAASVGQSDD